MKRITLLIALLGCQTSPNSNLQPLQIKAPTLRPPAIPLVVQTPYLNAWLMGDSLVSDWPKFWNGSVKGMAGIVEIDDKQYRFLGLPESNIPPMRQESVHIFPTRTLVDFSQDDVSLKLEFISPLDPNNLKLFSLPLVLIQAQVSSSSPRQVKLTIDISAEWAVGDNQHRVNWDGQFRIFPTQPRLFHETKDFADWGELHWRAIDKPTSAINTANRTPDKDNRFPRSVKDQYPVFAYTWDLGIVKQPITRRSMIAHVRTEATNYFGKPCLSYWTKHFKDAESMLSEIASQFDKIRHQMMQVDADVLSRAKRSGGEPLAALAALTFRQSFAACELVVCNDDVFYFSKEISSGSFIQTVDVIYPAAPILLAFNPDLLRYQLEPIFEAMRFWHEPFAMHDLGRYPNSTGQTYPFAMMVEETANMILLSASLKKHDPSFWEKHQSQLKAWAKYLVDAGFHLEHQLCTDDFAGPLAKNANLCIKSILALATLPEFREEAVKRMKRWLTETDVEDHTSMILGDKNTWSLKYNFFFDKLLNLQIIPQATINREIDYYQSQANKYGTPLNNRKAFTKADWLLWIAAIASKTKREAIIANVVKFYNETPDRIPATDWYETDSGKASKTPWGGFVARPVMGAAFAPILIDDQQEPVR